MEEPAILPVTNVEIQYQEYLLRLDFDARELPNAE